MSIRASRYAGRAAFQSSLFPKQSLRPRFASSDASSITPPSPTPSMSTAGWRLEESRGTLLADAKPRPSARLGLGPTFRGDDRMSSNRPEEGGSPRAEEQPRREIPYGSEQGPPLYDDEPRR